MCSVDSSLGDATTALEHGGGGIKHGSIFGIWQQKSPIIRHCLSQTFMWIADWFNQFSDKMFFGNMISEHLNYVGIFRLCMGKFI